MIFCWASSIQRDGQKSRILIFVDWFSFLSIILVDNIVTLIVFLCFHTANIDDNCCFLIRLSYRYVDDNMRIGRDDKGNIFVLERFEDNSNSQPFFFVFHMFPSRKVILSKHGQALIVDTFISRDSKFVSTQWESIPFRSTQPQLVTCIHCVGHDSFQEVLQKLCKEIAMMLNTH